MRSELKLALNVLARRKVFTAISLFGICATLVVLMIATAMLDNVFAPREPEQRFDRVLMVAVIGRYGPESSQTTNPGYGFLEKYVRTLHGVEHTAAYSQAQSTVLFRGDRRVETIVKHTDGAYWKILQFRFLEGRPFTEQEDRDGARVAVISDKLRAKLFDGRPAVGQILDLDGQRFRIVGVVPAVPFTRLSAYSEVWLPVGSYPSSEFRREFVGDFTGLVLARSRDDFPRLKREFAARIEAIHPEEKEFTRVVAGLDTPFEAAARLLVGNRADDRAPKIFRGAFILLALLFMTLPALNLVTLNLSRILERAGEIGVRKAFGAPRRALVRQFVTENVVLTLIGGCLAFVLAALAMPLLNGSGIVPDAQFDLNLRIFGYGMLIAAFFGVFSGLYPAWRMARLHPVDALRGGAL